MLCSKWCRIPGAAVAVMLAFAAAPEVHAQSQNSAQQDEDNFSPEHLRAARRTVEAAQVAQSFDEILPTIAEQTQTLFTRSYPSLTAQIEETTTQVAIEMAQRRPQLDMTVEKIWARRFTIEELNQIADFYETPTGEKLAELGPSISALSIGASKQWADAISTEMVEEVRQRLRAQGLPL
ncbi:DUF2059 domain-containing protein [Amorphus orientalis]|uniref:DUF2059 domain-containing protein n=1 Tax=Amorphus orientalis TaxID=649198 RepID=A0AAE3VPZ9_9HYPH|nr:DUF2059 domain-containing protein [Amorphus orientalis]MDQ0315967.1 hypothetical protein [Amorphus orientalis]